MPRTKISEAKVISFDIFDTLITRYFYYPTDLFQVIPLIQQDVLDINPIHFKQEREKAEQESRNYSFSKFNSYETTLELIYDCLAINLGLNEDQKELMLSSELEAERKNMIINPKGIELLKIAKQLKKRIILTSDMYLPKPFIEELLASFDIKYDAFYYSRESKINKASGKIFNAILQAEKIEAKDLLHIGDNKDSDVNVPSKLGIQSFHLNNKWQEKEIPQNSTLAISILKKLRYYKTEEKEYFHSFGYNYVGFIYYSFVKWLIADLKLKSTKPKKIFFLSRDGQVIKQVYDLIVSQLPESEKLPKSEYLYVSRRVLNLAKIDSLNDEDMNFLIGGTTKKNVGDFINRIGIPLDSPKVLQTLEFLGLTLSQEITSAQDYEKIRLFFRSLKHEIKVIANKERETLLKYLTQSDFLKDSSAIIVDVGWHGSLQVSLDKIINPLGGGVPIIGYYFGLYHAAQAYKWHHSMQGFFCNAQPNHPFEEFIKICPEIFEFIFSADHGTVTGYEDKGKIVPILDDKSAINLKEIQSMRKGAFEFIKDFMFIDKGTNFNIPIIDQDIMDCIYFLIKFPTNKDIENLGEIKHYEGFGKFLAKPVPLYSKTSTSNYWKFNQTRVQFPEIDY